MNPKIITSDAECRAARDHLARLRNREPSAERDSEIELWSLLIRKHEETVASASKRGPLDALMIRIRRSGFKRRPPGGAHRPPALARETWLFFGAAAVLVYLRLMHRAAFFPPFFEGEEGKVMDLAKGTCDYAAFTHSWWQAFTGGFFEYNKGYSWALVPFYLAYGYDVRLITYVLPVFFSLFLAAFFTIYRKTYPTSSLLSFVLAALFSVLCLSLRRYKWHSVTFLTALSVYLYFLPHFYQGKFFLGDRWRCAVSLFLFVFSCYFYFGCLIFAAPFLVLAVMLSGKSGRRRELAIACGALVVFAGLFFVTYDYTSVWRYRIGDEIAYLREDFSAEGLWERWKATRDFFFTLDLSLPYLLLFVAGSAASIQGIRRGDRFALVNGTLLLCLWVFQVAVQGLNNPDQLNWSMLPLLGIIMMGADRILVPLRDRVRGGAFVAAVAVALVGWNELRHYLPLNRDTPYQPFVQPHCTRTQAALVLMMIRDDESGGVQYFLPDPSVPESEGGFDYSVNLLRVDFTRAMRKVIFFSSEDELRRKLSAPRGSRRAVAYLSVALKTGGKDTPDPLVAPLLGQRPEVIHPFADVYGIDFPVRRFQLRSIPAPSPDSPGPLIRLP